MACPVGAHNPNRRARAKRSPALWPKSARAGPGSRSGSERTWGFARQELMSWVRAERRMRQTYNLSRLVPLAQPPSLGVDERHSLSCMRPHGMRSSQELTGPTMVRMSGLALCGDQG
jgi:hypothetical protein